jgi:hypothetical protein
VKRFIVKFSYVLALLCAIVGFLALLSSIAGAGGDNIMQQSGAFAFAIGLAVIPYCIARALEKLLT